MEETNTQRIIRALNLVQTSSYSASCILVESILVGGAVANEWKENNVIISKDV